MELTSPALVSTLMTLAVAQPMIPTVTPDGKLVERSAQRFRDDLPRGGRDGFRDWEHHDGGRPGCRNPVCTPGRPCPMYRCAEPIL